MHFINPCSVSSIAFVLSFASAFLPSLVIAQNANSPILAACLSTAGIETSLPTNATWSTDISAWQARISPIPAAVAYPQTEAEVPEILRCARESNVKVTILGGNRSFSSLGFGRDNDALVISMKYFTSMSVDSTTGDFTFGAGIVISQAVNYLWQTAQLAIPHGRCPDVGLAGVTLGGGFGTLSRLLGTPLDNLVRVKAVLSDGSVVSASATENSDLFWALRGAAPSFAVVTELTLKTWKPQSLQITNYTIAFTNRSATTIEQNANALLAIQEWGLSDENSDYLSMRWSLAKSSQGLGFFYGPPEEFNATMAPLMAKLPGMALTSQVNDFITSEEISTPGLIANSVTPRRYFFILSATITRDHPFTYDSAVALYNGTAYLPTRTDASFSGFADLWGGALSSEISDDSSAWAHGNDLWLVRYDARTRTPDAPWGADLIDYFSAGWESFLVAMRATGWTDRAFLNYRNSAWSQDEMAENLYGGGNWERLLELKREFDPIGMFNTDRNQSIPLVTA
ncbi:berberine-like protein [Phlyctema vagabunda]|uniref:Berberine-like protein n=1 Tax=Phlyctema vagabunda TaxID=108571 RepID=A0ABR4P5G7_9HELO